MPNQPHRRQRHPSRKRRLQADQAGSDLATPAAARQVVIDYYAAIDARDYTKAYSLWSDDGAASGQSFEHFSSGYANTRSVQASVGEATDEEGAAGSRYIEVPIELKALQQDGSERNYRGRFTLRAAMADGASEATSALAPGFRGDAAARRIEPTLPTALIGKPSCT